MSRVRNLLILAAAVAGGWYFLTHYRIQGLESLTVKPRTARQAAVSDTAGQEPNQPPVPPGRQTLRIATFNLTPLDQRKLSKRHVVAPLAKVIGRFDVVAVQGIRAQDQSVLVGFVEQINAEGRHYNFATSPAVAMGAVRQYSAFLFDQATVYIDRRTVCPVEDPGGRFRYEPLVASFVTRGPSPREAFTFTLITVHTDPNQTLTELDLLDDVFRAVRDNGRGEDDVILLGDLGADDSRLGQLRRIPNVTCAVSGLPSTTRGTLVDNLLFDRRATTEFTGRSGVVDLIREFDLSMQEALELSEHLPVWAEFSVYEGGQPGQVAAGPAGSTR
jgi:deoxyribonuclease-1-like protein